VGENWTVFRVDDDRATVTSVQTGERSGLAVEIVSGLEEGDQVIIYPSDQVSDGARVSPRT
jgi:HlyD family secretion protein